jgi:hypothetical protein
MAMKGPYREFFPVGEQKIKVRLPEGSQANAVHLLVADKKAGGSAQWSGTDNCCAFDLDHEVVAIDI